MAHPKKRSRPHMATTNTRSDPPRSPVRPATPGVGGTPDEAAASDAGGTPGAAASGAPGAPGTPGASGASGASGGFGQVSTRELLALGSALLLLLFLIKIYGVGRYSLTTTTALLAATPVQVALGTVTIYAYYILPAIALGTVWFAVRYRARIQPVLWPLILIVAAVTALASPYRYLLQGLFVVVAA